MVYVTGAVLLGIMLLVFQKSGHFFKSLFSSVLGGVGALCAVNAVSYFMPLTLGLNAYSLAFSSVFSVPGVIFLLLCDTFIF